MKINNLATRTQRWTRPFDGIGASLYIGSSLPLQYRNLQVENVCVVAPRMTANMSPTTRVASDTAAEGDELAIDIDVTAYKGATVYVDVRHFRDDVENEAEHPQRVTIDSGGDDVPEIRGIASLVDIEQRVGGVVRFTFRWTASVDGVQPTSFRLARTSGPTSPANVTISADGSGLYEIESVALSDSATYTFTVTAINGSTSLVVLTISGVQADATGPPSPSNVSVSVV